jgi:hypothetical protein
MHHALKVMNVPRREALMLVFLLSFTAGTDFYRLQPNFDVLTYAQG